MAAKKLKTYRVQRRYAIWVETPIKAASFEEAMTAARALDVSDFVTIDKDASFIDYDVLPGFGVTEEF
jgi:hypothetical protein